MKRLTKIAAGVLLGIGLPITLIACVRLLDPKIDPQDKFEIEAVLMVLGLPPTVAGGWLAARAIKRGREEEHDRLQSAFYRLLRENHGLVTVLHFAMETGLEGSEARAYLDARAMEFNATFPVSEEGNIAYQFDLGTSRVGLPPATGRETYDVILMEPVPANCRRQVVKAVHELTGWEWKRAKAIVRRLPEPVTLQQAVPKDVAEASRQRLEAAGAEILVILR